MIPDQRDVDELRDLLDLMRNFPDNDQRARFLLSSNWLRTLIGDGLGVDLGKRPRSR
jgi:hypothetical protein